MNLHLSRLRAVFFSLIAAACVVVATFVIGLLESDEALAAELTPGWTQEGTCEWRIENDELVVRPLGNAESGILGNYDGEIGSHEGDRVTAPPWRSQAFTSAVFGPGVHARGCAMLFAGCTQLRFVDFSGLDTSKAWTMIGMFSGCSSLQAVDLSGFNTSRVSEMTSMFFGCSSLDKLDLSSFDTSSVRDMSWMFTHCTKLTTIFCGNNFEVPLWSSAPTDHMFDGCSSLVGGAGTMVIPPRYGGAYACVDDPINGKPGYFTLKGQPPYNQNWSGSVEVEFQASITNTSRETEIFWDDAWFDVSSYEYNHQLATTAAVLSASAYKESLIKDALGKLGFEEDVFTYYPSQSDYKTASKGGYDQVAYAFGVRFRNDGKPIIAIIIRGTPGNYEWISNLNIANTTEESAPSHEGFLLAEGKVLDAFRQYVKAQQIDLNDARVVIAGHSRGAAVANLLGYALDNGAGNVNGSLTSDRIYDFTFEAPAVTTRNTSGYENIFNIASVEDVVTKVPLEKWGYGLYGKTFVLPSKSNMALSSSYRERYNAMNSIFRTYTDSVDYMPCKDGSLFSDGIVQSVYSSAPSIKAFYKYRYGSMTDWMGLTTRDVVAAIGALVWDDVLEDQTAGTVTLMRAAGIPAYQTLIVKLLGTVAVTEQTKFVDAVTHAHTQETYISWMQSGLPSEIFIDKYKRMTICCPVDVYVHDANGNLVASIEDDIVDESVLEFGLAAAVSGETKYVDIPADGDYQISIVAREDGMLSVSAEDKALDSDDATIKTYCNIQIAQNEAFSCELEENDAARDMVLVDAETGVEAQAEMITTDDAESYAAVVVGADGPGEAWGSARAVRGSSAFVYAQHNESSRFIGWYEGGKLVSSDETYVFRLEDNRILTAMFVATAEESTGQNVAQITTQSMHRLYNPNSGEHFYTANVGERNMLIGVGWNYEGIGWTAPASSKSPVYRLYNANAGDHHYTMSAGERDMLMRVGWSYEGIGWYSDDAKGVALYRQYNPNAQAGSHNYTTSQAEHNQLVAIGWQGEGIGWYGCK